MEPGPSPENPAANYALAAVGAAAGGALGYLAFSWLVRQGFYALALPGAAAGLGCSWLIKRRSLLFASACGLFAVGIGIFSRWRIDAYDRSFPEFLAHLPEMSAATLVMIAVGGAFGFWFALGRKQSAPRDSV